MRAAELIAPQNIPAHEMPIEDPGPGEVQVRIEAVGVCGSDLHAYTEGAVGGMPNVYPMVLGHEPAGTIVKTGAGVTGLAAGDRGALEPALYCYHCEYCLSGHHNVCANIRFLSNPHHPGFFRELVNLPVVNFCPSRRGCRLAKRHWPSLLRSGCIRCAWRRWRGRDGGGDRRGTYRADDDCRVARRKGRTNLGGGTAGASARAGTGDWRGRGA